MRTWGPKLFYFLLALAALSAALVALATTDVTSTPIASLPAWYWALLACTPIVTLLILITNPGGTRTNKAGSPETKLAAWVSVAHHAFSALVFFALVGINLIGQPKLGGLTAFFIMAGTNSLLFLGSSLTRLRAT